MYIEPGFSAETAAAVKNLEPWLTNEFEHDGLGIDGRVMERLLAIVTGEG